MNVEAERVVRGLLRERSVAALGTIQESGPYVSLVPFALARDGLSIVVHVSRLAAHTRNLIGDPRVSLLVAAEENAETMPQALARVTLVGTAAPVAPDHPDYTPARAAYLSRFPDAAELFTFGDFLLVRIEIRSARFVGGFGQASTLTPEALAAAATGLGR